MLDAGVLIAHDRGDMRASQAIRALRQTGAALMTTEPVLAQVWRNGARQAVFARLLRSVQVIPFDDGRSVGQLLGDAGTSDVVDAHLVLTAARTGDAVITGDPDDLRRLARVFGEHAPTIHAWP